MRRLSLSSSRDRRALRRGVHWSPREGKHCGSFALGGMHAGEPGGLLRAQCPVQILQQVIDVLDAHGESDEIVRDFQ